MAKKQSASSQRERLVRVGAEDIKERPLNAKDKVSLARIAAKQAAGDDSGIDYSDIPELTEAQLAEFRPARAKQLVTVRLDAEVADWLRSFGPGHSTRINGILRKVMENSTR